MLDHVTGRSRGFGFVTFASEDAVERLFSEGNNHELGGKLVKIQLESNYHAVPYFSRFVCL